LIKQSSPLKAVYAGMDEQGKGLTIKEISIPQDKIIELEIIC